MLTLILFLFSIQEPEPFCPLGSVTGMGNGVREGQVDFKGQDVEPTASAHLPAEVQVRAWGLRAMG